MKQRGPQAPSAHAMPSAELLFCIVCGTSGGWKYDKLGRPYISCSACTVRIFPHGHISLSGLEILHEMVRRSGVQRHQQAVQVRVNRRLHDEHRRNMRAAAGTR